eukprot:scaffold3575_cov254-Pinguiococcus_pyrenoidosus.AAC.13
MYEWRALREVGRGGRLTKSKTDRQTARLARPPAPSPQPPAPRGLQLASEQARCLPVSPELPQRLKLVVQAEGKGHKHGDDHGGEPLCRRGRRRLFVLEVAHEVVILVRRGIQRILRVQISVPEAEQRRRDVTDDLEDVRHRDHAEHQLRGRSKQVSSRPIGFLRDGRVAAGLPLVGNRQQGARRILEDQYEHQKHREAARNATLLARKG